MVVDGARNKKEEDGEKKDDEWSSRRSAKHQSSYDFPTYQVVVEYGVKGLANLS